jgi:hypothetical protein
MAPGDSAERPARRGRRILVRALVAVAVGLLMLEGAMRLVLFVDVPGLERVSLRLRQPSNFFMKLDPGWWTTSVRFTPPERLKPIPGYDPVVGWAGSRVTPRTYAHQDEPLLLGRRPVLLYGDSFAECTTGARECWQGLLYDSELGETHLMLNYGVGGYGMDQTILMVRQSIPRFEDLDPVVIVSVFVDDDLNRMLLPFRGWPKPRFHARDGELLEPGPIPEGAPEFVRENAPFVWSWTWRYLRHTVRWMAPPPVDVRPEVEELSHHLLAALKSEMETRDQEFFVLLFQGMSLLGASARESVWQHGFLVDALRELGIPFVTCRRELLAYRGARPKSDGTELFEQTGNAKGHYTALGNRVVFPAILRGMRGEFD